MLLCFEWYNYHLVIAVFEYSLRVLNWHVLWEAGLLSGDTWQTSCLFTKCMCVSVSLVLANCPITNRGATNTLLTPETITLSRTLTTNTSVSLINHTLEQTWHYIKRGTAAIVKLKHRKTALFGPVSDYSYQKYLVSKEDSICSF